MTLKSYLLNTFTILIFFAFITSSCRSTKQLKKEEALITKLQVKGLDKQFSEQAKSYVSVDIQPNSKFNLWLYNSLSNKGKNKLGEAPHLLDSVLVEVSRKQIEGFLNNKGFLNAKVKSNITIQKKRAEIGFVINAGTLFKIRNLDFDIADSAVKKIYLDNRASFTRLHAGARYDIDSVAFEREQIYLLMKKNGYYDFVRQYVRPFVDTTFNIGIADIKIQILNPKNDNKHPIYTLGNSIIRIQSSAGIVENEVPDSLVIDQQYKFYDYSHFFKPKKIAPYIFLKKGDLYNIDKTELTTRRLFDLNAVRNVNIEFIKLNDTTRTLLSAIDIIPLKKILYRVDGEYNWNSSVTGLSAGFTFQNRNVFGGAELFEVKLSGGLQFDRSITGSLADRILSKDYQIGASLTFPRLISFFKIPNSGSFGVPKTIVSSSYQVFQYSSSYLRKSLGASLSYNWLQNKLNSHTFSPSNIQFVKGLISQDLREELESQGNGYFVNTLKSQLLSSSSYGYIYNQIKLNSLSDFTYLSANAEIGGNTAAIAGNIFNNTNSDGNKILFGVPYYQFLKLSADVRFYHFLGGQRQFIARINSGFALAYGNVKSLPFEKQFFAGGSSGVRAWQARTLGPGNYNRASLSSDMARNNLRNLDQLGDLKFESNLEYRFKLLNNFIGGSVKGATFVDFGNVWQLKDTGFDGAKIKWNQLFSQTAIGTGFGLRIDWSYFILRLDAGFKFKDPQFSGSDQYVFKYWFNRNAKKTFKSNYAISNSPDTYSLSQIQFGVGLPF